MEWQPIETAPRERGKRIIGWCTFPAGAEAREIKCFIWLDRPNAEPMWLYYGISQTVTHWMPMPEPPQ